MTFRDRYEKELENTRESLRLALERLEDGDEMGYLEVALEGAIRQTLEMKMMIALRRLGTDEG